MKRSVFFTVRDDVFADGRIQPRYAQQERRRCCIQVCADRVDAILYNAVKGLSEPFLRHIVLILPDADRLRLNLDQLRQRVLQASGDRNGAPERQIQLRQFRGGEL